MTPYMCRHMYTYRKTRMGLRHSTHISSYRNTGTVKCLTTVLDWMCVMVLELWLTTVLDWTCVIVLLLLLRMCRRTYVYHTKRTDQACI